MKRYFPKPTFTLSSLLATLLASAKPMPHALHLSAWKTSCVLCPRSVPWEGSKTLKACNWPMWSVAMMLSWTFLDSWVSTCLLFGRRLERGKFILAKNTAWRIQLNERLRATICILCKAKSRHLGRQVMEWKQSWTENQEASVIAPALPCWQHCDLVWAQLTSEDLRFPSSTSRVWD